MRAWIALPCVLIACGGAGPASESFEAPALDAEALRHFVQPELERMCAQTACHGAPERRWSIFGTHARRLDPTWSSPSLSEAEYAANIEATRALLGLTADPLDSDLLRKPLRVEAGGVGHAGGDQFYDRGDPSFVLLACWAMGRTGCRP